MEPSIRDAAARGVVARLGDEMVGFAVMTGFLPAPREMTAEFFAPRSANVAYQCHAAREDCAYAAYRAMYAVLAEDFVARGYFDHVAYVAPSDAAVNEALVSLGFGRSVTEGIRGVEPVDATLPPNVAIHRAAAEDIDVIVALAEDLRLHHAAAPIFMPHFPEADDSIRAFQAELLRDPDTNAHFLAYEDGKPVGMNSFMAPTWVTDMIRPEKTVYLYQGIVSERARRGGLGRAILARGIDWAREQGYEHVALHYVSANLPGAEFWESAGFRPVEYRMVRRVDERIAWAGATH